LTERLEVGNLYGDVSLLIGRLEVGNLYGDVLIGKVIERL